MNKRPPAPTLQIFQQNKKLKQGLVCEPPMTQGPIQSQAPNYCPNQSFNQSKSYQHNSGPPLLDYNPGQHNSGQHNSGSFDHQNYVNDTQESIPSYQRNTNNNNLFSQGIQRFQNVKQYQRSNTYNGSYSNINEPLVNQNNGTRNTPNYAGNPTINESLMNQNNCSRNTPNYAGNPTINESVMNQNNGSRNTPNYAGNPNIYTVHQSAVSPPYGSYNHQKENYQNMPQGYLQNNAMQMPNNMIAPQSHHQMPSYQQGFQQKSSYEIMSYNKNQQTVVNMNSTVPHNNLGYNTAPNNSSLNNGAPNNVAPNNVAPNNGAPNNGGYHSTPNKYMGTTATSLIANRPVIEKIEEKKEEKKGQKDVKKNVSRGCRTISCTISSLLHWSKYSEQCPMLFELYACVESVAEDSGVCKKFRVSDSEGGLLNCVYYNMVSIPPILHAKHYRLLGKMNSNSTLQCVKMKEVSYNSANPDLIKQSNISMSKFVLQFNEQ